MKTALFYMYGLPQDVEKESIENDYNSASLFENPDSCEDCGGKVKWKRTKLMDLTIRGTCTSCGKEIVRHE